MDKKSYTKVFWEIGSLLFLFATLESAILSVEQVNWITPQPPLTVILALSLLAGYLLAKSHLPRPIAHSIAVVVGALVTVWQVSHLLSSPGLMSTINQIMTALQSSWQTISAARPSEGTTHFAVFLIFFTWLIGYVSAWFLRRRQSPWPGIVLGALVVVTNLSNSTEEYHRFLFFYLLFALLLLAETNLAREHERLKKHDSCYSRRSILYYLTLALGLSSLVVSLAWVTPEVRASRLETLVTTRMLWQKNIENYLSNFVASIPAKQSSLKSDEQQTLFFGDSWSQSSEVHFVVKSTRASYWRMRTYDVYTPAGWTSSAANENDLGSRTSQSEAVFFKRSEVSYSVVTNLKTDTLLTAGELIASDTPVVMQTLAPRSYEINLLSGFNDRSLPSEIVTVARSLRTAKANSSVFGTDEVRRLLPDDLTLKNAIEVRTPDASQSLGNQQLVSIEVSRKAPTGGNVAVLSLPFLLKPGQSYTATSSVSSAGPEELAQAGENYPHWVTDYYLQLPPNLPDRIKRLSENVTRGLKSPYAKAEAVRQYLSQFPYRLKVEMPPSGSDTVDYFLFSQKSGFCVYFASSMAVMLRSVNVPARLAIGYTAGEMDAASGDYILRAKDAHAWPEVYFPGYGWVAFEASPLGNDEAVSQPEEELVSDFSLDSETNSGLGSAFPEWLGPVILLALVGAIIILSLAWSAFRRWLRQFTGQDYATQIYAQLCFVASLVKLGPHPQQTPLEYGTSLASTFPQQKEAIGNVIQTYVQRRFSPRRDLRQEQKEKLRQSWRVVYSTLLKRVFQLKKN